MARICEKVASDHHLFYEFLCYYSVIVKSFIDPDHIFNENSKNGINEGSFKEILVFI